MKIAYLVLAHDCPQQLRKLVDAIQAPWADIFIHIDKKAELGPFIDACAGAPVHFHEPRRKINWGGWGSVQIQLEMLEAARSSKYKYYKLLSGHCYPVKSREQVRECLERNEANLMDFWSVEPRMRACNTVDYPHFVDLIPIENFLREDRFRVRPLYYLLRHPVQILYWGLFYALIYHAPRLRRLILPKRKRPMPVYGAEMWWCLRHDFVEYLLDFCRNQPRVVRYFRYARPPNEYMVPSILRASSFPWEDTTMHLNCHGTMTGELLDQHLQEESPTLFARKFDGPALALLEKKLASRDRPVTGAQDRRGRGPASAA